VGENFMVGWIFGKMVKEKGEACTMDGRRWLKPSHPNWKPWCVMDSKHNKCAVHKVRIKRFDHNPSTIELAWKTSKANDKWEARKQQSVEALTCPCKHPSVIKFFAIHTKTMEAYTLWWNGGTLQEILDYNTKYSPITNNCTLLR
jgi:Fe-S-cluster containining protein